MSDLDKKLEDIVTRIFYKGASSGLDYPNIAKLDSTANWGYVEETKQAFIDAGWQPSWIGPDHIVSVGLDKIEPPTIDYDTPPKERFGEPIPFMTGQEWYDKFTKELPEDIVVDYDSEKNVSFHAGNNHGLRTARKAAKRASGVE